MKIKILIILLFLITITGFTQDIVALETKVLKDFDFKLNGSGAAHEGTFYFIGNNNPYILDLENNRVKDFPEKVYEFLYSADIGIAYKGYGKYGNQVYKYYDFNENKTDIFFETTPAYNRFDFVITRYVLAYTGFLNKSSSEQIPYEPEYRIVKYMKDWYDDKEIFEQTYFQPRDFSDDKNLFLLTSSTELLLLDTITDETIGTNKEPRGNNWPAKARFINNQLGFTIFPNRPEADQFLVFDVQGQSIQRFNFKGIKSIKELWISPNLDKALVQPENGNAKLISCPDLRDFLDKKRLVFHPLKALVAKDLKPMTFANFMAHEIDNNLKAGAEVLLIDRSSLKRKLHDKLDYYYKVNVDGTPGWIHGSLLNIEHSEEQNQAKPEKTASLPKPLHIKNLTVTSALTEPNDKDAYHPVKAFDSNPKTMWIEAADGPGLGEYLEVEFSHPITIDRIEMQPGCFWDENYWKQNNRVKDMTITLDDKSLKVKFSDVMKTQGVGLKKPVTVQKARFTINNVYKTTNWDDTAISDIWFLYKDRRINIDLGDYAGVLK